MFLTSAPSESLFPQSQYAAPFFFYTISGQISIHCFPRSFPVSTFFPSTLRLLFLTWLLVTYFCIHLYPSLRLVDSPIFHSLGILSQHRRFTTLYYVSQYRHIYHFELLAAHKHKVIILSSSLCYSRKHNNRIGLTLSQILVLAKSV